eukprot:CAMPEP_0182862290 /NCGR_PEP_ID=MMETSP0034_2-20130328/5981_1 /TAXON_ID=156128 /ORGANISM="Nephroselmis pyriformis, Strain CCMP717" /LENGTH=94 /DNA_ID=CAMNT_0024994333 /DNA_START=168 /DNA_END=451 /DNA_ORIENTATION=-
MSAHPARGGARGGATRAIDAADAVENVGGPTGRPRWNVYKQDMRLSTMRGRIPCAREPSCICEGQQAAPDLMSLEWKCASPSLKEGVKGLGFRV